MDIAFVWSPIYPFCKGGAEKRIYEIGRRLADDGHDVTLYGNQWWQGPEEIELDGMIVRGVGPKRDQFRGDRRSITEALRFSKDLAEPLRENVDDHDLVVVSVSEHFPVWISKIITSIHRTPLAVTWHEVWDRKYWMEYLGPLGIIGWIVQLITAQIPQKPIAVSASTAADLARVRRIQRGRDTIDVVPNGVDVSSIQSTSIVDDGFDVLYVGRLIPEKNVDLLLRAFDEIACRYDLTLGVIGDGVERDRLEALAASLTHTDRVTFLGFVEEDEDVHAHMRAARVFVLPSIREGFGITLVEAMAAGCAAVTVSHPNSATSEIVGEHGFVAEASVPSLAEAMIRAIDGETLGSGPIERALEFDWDRIARRAVTVYDTVIQ